MERPLMPWYAPSQLPSDWMENPYVKEDYPAFYQRSLRFHMTPRLMTKFLERHVSMVEFAGLERCEGICIPYDFAKWKISVNNGSSKTEQSKTLVHEVLHGFYRAQGNYFRNPGGDNLIIEEHDKPEWLNSPQMFEMVRNQHYIEVRINRLTDLFFDQNQSYSLKMLDRLTTF